MEDNYIIDLIQMRVYHISECDQTMLDLFPDRYIKVVLSDFIKSNINSK